MAVGINEGGHQGAALQIHHLRALSGGGHHLTLTAGRHDAASGDRYGLHPGLCVHHGEDRAATKDQRCLGWGHGICKRRWLKETGAICHVLLI